MYFLLYNIYGLPVEYLEINGIKYQTICFSIYTDFC